MQIEGSFTCVLFIATLIRAALVSLEHCHGFPNVDFATPGAVSQGLHLADVTVIEVLDSIDFWELIISILCCDFNLLEQVLVLNEKVVKFTIVLLGWIIFWHFHVLNTFSWGFLFNFYVLDIFHQFEKLVAHQKVKVTLRETALAQKVFRFFKFDVTKAKLFKFHFWERLNVGQFFWR